MLKLRADFSQAGDTIVEVIVVLAVFGLALSISYATANRSLLNTRQAEENAQATRYVQSQIESLYTLSSASDAQTNGIFSQTGPFCMPNPTTIDAASNTACSNYDNLGFYTVNVYYCDKFIAIPCPNPASGADTFTVQITWPDVSGEGSDSVTQSYRIHPGEGTS